MLMLIPDVSKDRRYKYPCAIKCTRKSKTLSFAPVARRGNAPQIWNQRRSCCWGNSSTTHTWAPGEALTTQSGMDVSVRQDPARQPLQPHRCIWQLQELSHFRRERQSQRVSVPDQKAARSLMPAGSRSTPTRPGGPPSSQTLPRCPSTGWESALLHLLSMLEIPALEKFKHVRLLLERGLCFEGRKAGMTECTLFGLKFKLSLVSSPHGSRCPQEAPGFLVLHGHQRP